MVIRSKMNYFVKFVGIFYGNHIDVHHVNRYFVKNVFKDGLKIQIVLKVVHLDVEYLKIVDVHHLFNQCYLE
jgi:hypothetical protein